MANFSEVIDRLIKKRAQLRAELAKLDDAIETLSSLDDLFVNDEEKAVAGAYAEDALGQQVEAQRERGILPPEEISRLAREVLLDHGRPLKRGALVKAMEAKSIPMTGRDKAKNLGTILWRHLEDFVNLEKHGYWPRDIPLKGIYDPKSPPDGVKSRRL